MRRVILIILLALACGPACIAPTNPFDPDTPVQSQEPGTLSGTIFALRAPTVDDDDRPIAAPGPCALSSSDGDNSGFAVTLQRLPVEEGAIETPPTNASGAFVVRNLIPGVYALSIRADGFSAPPLEQVEIEVGGAVTRTFCAFDAVAPPSPLLDALPATVGPDDSVTLRVLNPEPSAVYSITERALDTPPLRQTITPSPDAPLSVPLSAPLSLSAQQGRRIAWTVDVVASDALGNASAPAVVTIVRDALAPAAPVDVRASSARDRVFVSFAPAPPVDAGADDDAPVAFYVSYAVVPRPPDPLDDCPLGKPFDDVPDDAFFAAEGASPLLTTATEVTLSGLVPGTELYLYVAAVDAVGNVSCYAPGVFARTDEVTFAPVPDAGPGVAGPKAMVALPASTLGALPGGFDDGATIGVPEGDDRRRRGLYAIAGATTVVVDIDGVAHELRDEGEGGAAGPAIAANDLAVAGDVLVLAGGPRGVGTVALDARGAPTGVVAFDGISDVNAVAGEPGVVFAAAANGLFVNGVRIDIGAFVDVALLGNLVVAIKRGEANHAVVVYARRANRDGLFFTVLGSKTFLDPPLGTAVVGRSLVVVDAVGVRAFGLADCLDAFPSGCIIDELPRRSLPFVDVGADERQPGRAVGALDEIALVGDGAGEVFAVALPSLQVVGRTRLPGGVGAFVVDELGFCAAVDGGDGDTQSLRCASATAFPVQDGEERASTEGPALDVVVVDGHVVASGGDVVTLAPLDDLDDKQTIGLEVPGFACDLVPGCEVADLGVAAGAALVLRDDGLLLAVRSGGGSVVVHLGAEDDIRDALGDGPYQGRIVATGSTALVALAAAPREGGGPAVVVRLSLRFTPSGDVGADVEDVLALPPLRALASLGIHGDTAWLTTSPRGLLRFQRAPALALATGSVVPDVVADTQGRTFAGGLALVGSKTTPLIASRDGDGIDGIGRFEDGAFVALRAVVPPALGDLRRAGRFVAATTLDGGVWLLDPAEAGGTIAAVLSLPSATNATEVVATARGLVIADADGGVLRVLVR